MHLLDRAAIIGFHLSRKGTTVFPDGWGDETSLALLPTAGFSHSISEMDIVWGRKEEHRGYRVRRGQATSPAADLLPPASRVVPLELVDPGVGSEQTCLLMPAWNEHGFERRRRLAAHLAARGIGSISFDIPFYGARRVTSADTQPIRTVADFALMGWGAVVEGLSLIATLSRERRVGVAGFSMGGNLAALIAALSPTRVAMAGMAASHSPGPVYLDGVLRHAIAWSSLGGEDTGEERLRRVLGSASVLSVAPLPHLAAAVLVIGERDGFVPRSASEALASHWPGSDLRVVRGAGHATLLWRHSIRLVEAAADSFDRLALLPPG